MNKIVLLILYITANNINLFAQNEIEFSKLMEVKDIVYYKNSNKTFSGKTINWYPNGQIQFEGNYEHGKKYGKWIGYYENGQKQFDGYFIDNKKNGIWGEWYANGQERFRGCYKDDKYDVLVLRWTEDGILIEDFKCTNGLLEGCCKFYYENGEKKFIGFYKNGKLNGSRTEYYSNGTIRLIANYKDGVIDGSYEENDLTKNLIIKGNFTDGLKEGTFTFLSNNETFAPNRILRARMNYIKDKLDGKYISWNYKHEDNNIWIASKTDQVINYPVEEYFKKMEGCFINGNPTGVFKFWIADSSGKNPLNTYYRQIWENGQIRDNGLDDKGRIILFNSDGTLTNHFKRRLKSNVDRFTKNYFSPCED